MGLIAHPKFVQRMQAEYEELRLNITRLAALIEGPYFEDMDQFEQLLLKGQRYHMEQYKSLLAQRLAFHDAKPE